MNKKLGTGLIILFFFLSLAGICNATDTPGYLATLSGGESTIINGTQDMMIITVHNPDPYLNITNEDNNSHITIDLLQNASLPINAVAAFYTPETKSISLVKINNISTLDNNDNLKFQVEPLQFYDGKTLSSYAQNTVNLQDLDNKTFNSTELYFELISNIPENWHDSGDSYELCLLGCHGAIPCERLCNTLRK